MIGWVAIGGCTLALLGFLIPWARTMVVTDRIVSILTPDELRAVLAHEAGHLSEGWSVIAARLLLAAIFGAFRQAGPPPVTSRIRTLAGPNLGVTRKYCSKTDR